MSAQHTPGPWSLHPYGAGESLVVGDDTSKPWISWKYSVGLGSKIITEVSACSDGGQGYPRPDNKPECEANARLIAAAPELLEMLEVIISDIGYSGYWWGQDAVNLIAKALGKENEQ
jgi:hypothetical protein